MDCNGSSDTVQFAILIYYSFIMPKYVVVSLVFAVSILLVGCTPGQQSNNNNNNNNQPEQQNDQQNNQQSSNDSTAGDVNVCITNCNVVGGNLAATCTQGCWIQEAERVGDPNLCMKNLSDEMLQVGCVANAAGAKGKPEFCDILGGSADICYAAYAADQKDTSVCAKIKDAMYRGICEGSANE